MRGDAPFAAFEGFWNGRWNDTDVAHLWLTIEPGVQLVLLSDDGVVSQGINLIAEDNKVCGLVVTPDGKERLHQGRFFAATDRSPAYLKWLTPKRHYYERVTHLNDERRYEILEEIVDGKETRWGTVARYTAAKILRGDALLTMAGLKTQRQTISPSTASQTASGTEQTLSALQSSKQSPPCGSLAQ